MYTGSTTIVIFANDASHARDAATRLVRRYRKLRSGSAAVLEADARDPNLSCKGRRSATRVPLGSSREPLRNSFTRVSNVNAPLPAASCEPSHAVDPINVVWYGRHASADQVAQELGRFGGWNSNDEELGSWADHQYVRTSRSSCARESQQRASACAICDRDHIRLFDVGRGRARFAVGDAHYDKDVFFNPGCVKLNVIPAGHISSSFTASRDEIGEFWPNRGSPPRLAYWGNTRRLRQCDGSMPHSDGYVLEEGT
jgi:hypothetical protein